MDMHRRFAPLKTVMTNKTVVIATCAAIALFLGALSAGSLVFFHKKLPFNLGRADSSTAEPSKRTSSTSSGVAGAQTGQGSAATAPDRVTTSHATGALSSTKSSVVARATSSSGSAPNTPSTLPLPPIAKPPAGTTGPVPVTVPSTPAPPTLPPLQPAPNQTSGEEDGPLGLDLGLDLTVHIGLPLHDL